MVERTQPSPVHDFLAGCIGGAAGAVVGHPFDTIKVRLVSQTVGSSNVPYSGPLQCLTSVVRNEGYHALFKGIASPVYSVAAINAILFGVQAHTVRYLGNADSLRTHLIAGCAAGLVQSVINSPMELLKIRMQNSVHNESLVNSLRVLYKHAGITGLYRGMMSTVLRDVPALGSYFFTYELMKQQLSLQGQPSAAGLLMAGGLAGTVSWILTYPIDVMKTRMQSDGFLQHQGGVVYRYGSYMHCLQAGLREQGYRMFLRGFSPAIIRSFPVNAATFAVYEWYMGYLRRAKSSGDNQETELSSFLYLPGDTVISLHTM